MNSTNQQIAQVVTKYLAVIYTGNGDEATASQLDAMTLEEVQSSPLTKETYDKMICPVSHKAAFRELAFNYEAALFKMGISFIPHSFWNEVFEADSKPAKKSHLKLAA